MNICGNKNSTPRKHELIPGHIYTCSLDTDVRLCAVDYNNEMKIYNLRTGKLTNGSPHVGMDQYTDVTDDWCLERVKS